MSRDSEVDRRRFLGVTAAAAAAMFIKPALVHGTHANSAIRIGLLGCGGRGTEDAGNLLDTGGARVVALADLFQDQQIPRVFRTPATTAEQIPRVFRTPATTAEQADADGGIRVR